DDQGTGLGTTVGYAHLRPRYRVAALRPSTTRSDSAGHRHALLPFALGVAKRSRRGGASTPRLRRYAQHERADQHERGFLPGSARTGFSPNPRSLTSPAHPSVRPERSEAESKGGCFDSAP